VLIPLSTWKLYRYFEPPVAFPCHEPNLESAPDHYRGGLGLMESEMLASKQGGNRGEVAVLLAEYLSILTIWLFPVQSCAYVRVV
jgi:hypothetical protein